MSNANILDDNTGGGVLDLVKYHSFDLFVLLFKYWMYIERKSGLTLWDKDISVYVYLLYAEQKQKRMSFESRVIEK